ncbi:hypothetical protein D3C71_1986350 [compost metagenome]
MSAELEELSERIGAAEVGGREKMLLEQQTTCNRSSLMSARYYSNAIQNIQKEHVLNLAEVRRLQSAVKGALGEVSAMAQGQ